MQVVQNLNRSHSPQGYYPVPPGTGEPSPRSYPVRPQAAQTLPSSYPAPSETWKPQGGSHPPPPGKQTYHTGPDRSPYASGYVVDEVITPTPHGGYSASAPPLPQQQQYYPPPASYETENINSCPPSYAEATALQSLQDKI